MDVDDRTLPKNQHQVLYMQLDVPLTRKDKQSEQRKNSEYADPNADARQKSQSGLMTCKQTSNQTLKYDFGHQESAPTSRNQEENLITPTKGSKGKQYLRSMTEMQIDKKTNPPYFDEDIEGAYNVDESNKSNS